MRNLKNLLSFIINLIFPHSCISCGVLTQHNYYTGFCLNCLNKTKRFNINQHPNLINIVKEAYFDSFQARFVYNDTIARIILSFKFYDKVEFGQYLAKALTKNIEDIENYQECLIIPVPIHTKRLLNRKYNQASILSKVLSKSLNIKHSNFALKRVKHTPHQTGQSARIRKNQLSNAFLAKPSKVLNKDIILIDDVFTTGSTVNLCAKELKAKGANKVHILTIAYTEI